MCVWGGGRRGGGTAGRQNRLTGFCRLALAHTAVCVVFDARPSPFIFPVCVPLTLGVLNAALRDVCAPPPSSGQTRSNMVKTWSNIRDPLALVLNPSELPPVACEVLACCQSLVHVEGELIGDPLEKAALEVRSRVGLFLAPGKGVGVWFFGQRGVGS